MPNEGQANSKTNSEPNSAKEVQIDCPIIWGAAHQFAYMRLSEKREANATAVDLLDCYNTRARRIAATYARMYLETEDGFDPAKKGRFYWMALGAFASKTVACLLDTWQIKRSYGLGRHLWDKELVVISEGLGLGNLWLFMDVSVWHWAYANHPNNYFEGMNCEPQRDTRKLPKGPVFDTLTSNLEWSNYAPEKINHLQSTKYIKEGMQEVEKIENETNKFERQKLQMNHLKAVANHEQLAILQPLIYDHPIFSSWIKKQRNNYVYNTFSPKYELVFSSTCSTTDPALKSVAPEDMELEMAGTLADAEQESPKTRMGWIGQAAQDFHNNMQHIIRGPYMEKELKTMAAWVDEPDFSDSCISVESVSGYFK